MKILIAVDDSEACLQACRLVAAYAGERSALEVVLLNVQAPPLRLSPEPLVPQAVLDEALLEQGQRQLARAQALLQAAGWSVTGLVRVGLSADVLLEVAREQGCGLLVMGTGRKGLLRGYALGSASLRVAPAAPCPVVLVRPDAVLPQALGVRLRVAVPVDGSPESTGAVRRLASWAPLLGRMQVDLLHFGPGLSLAGAIAPPHDDVVDRWSGQGAQAALAEPVAVLSAAGIAHQAHVLTGEPASGIAAFARDHGAELIAMGSRGLGAVQHLVLGSVTLTTAQRSPVPVLVMR